MFSDHSMIVIVFVIIIMNLLLLRCLSLSTGTKFDRRSHQRESSAIRVLGDYVYEAGEK